MKTLQARSGNVETRIESSVWGRADDGLPLGVEFYFTQSRPTQKARKFFNVPVLRATALELRDYLTSVLVAPKDDTSPALYRVSRYAVSDLGATVKDELLFIGPMTSLRSILLLHKEAVQRIETTLASGQGHCDLWGDRGTPWTLGREVRGGDITLAECFRVTLEKAQ